VVYEKNAKLNSANIKPQNPGWLATQVHTIMHCTGTSRKVTCIFPWEGDIRFLSLQKVNSRH